MLRGDLSAGVAWVKAREGVTEEDLVMIGHSAGGGLVQDFLGKGGRAGGMVLVGSFPWWGGFGVYKNWFRLDPWFLLRYYIRDFWHPRSPLSSTTLVKRAFFCDEYPDEQVREFERWMPEFESMLWPLGQMFAFTSVEEVLRGIVGWGTGKGSRVLVVAGERDRLMTGDLMGELAGGYEVGVKRILGEEGMVKGDEEKEVEVRVLEVVKGAGHHVQNDLQWVDGAERILRFLEQL
ncbi:hypothetical protein M7I_0991 [Glarea lozoyensis 74030]|uniref:AB hydrolase-1 domain-containing protein n=1 Tax=Glarea lozoyensis (strain ATCC 74030 / MF5533) TaxID=1104152 RepID=H0EEV6_GLAL7|nr:hypothetical protein M7I_0991 [Glarea lozoyensis 74030]